MKNEIIFSQKPIILQVEDGNFHPADPDDVHQCDFCQKWYLDKNIFKLHRVCSIGCHLKITETLSDIKIVNQYK
jgi:hypothetical protein